MGQPSYNKTLHKQKADGSYCLQVNERTYNVYFHLHFILFFLPLHKSGSYESHMLVIKKLDQFRIIKRKSMADLILRRPL